MRIVYFIVASVLLAIAFGTMAVPVSRRPRPSRPETVASWTAEGPAKTTLERGTIRHEVGDRTLEARGMPWDTYDLEVLRADPLVAVVCGSELLMVTEKDSKLEWHAFPTPSDRSVGAVAFSSRESCLYTYLIGDDGASLAKASLDIDSGQLGPLEVVVDTADVPSLNKDAVRVEGSMRLIGSGDDQLVFENGADRLLTFELPSLRCVEDRTSLEVLTAVTDRLTALYDYFVPPDRAMLYVRF